MNHGRNPIPPLWTDTVREEHGLASKERRRIVRIAHGVNVLRPQPGVAQTPGGGLLRQLPGGEGYRALAVFAAAEPLLFRGGNDLTVNHKGRRGIVEYGDDSQHPHTLGLPVSGRVTRCLGRGLHHLFDRDAHQGRMCCLVWIFGQLCRIVG